MKILIISYGYPRVNALKRNLSSIRQKLYRLMVYEVIFVSIDLRSIRRKRKLGKHWTEKEGIPLLIIPFRWEDSLT